MKILVLNFGPSSQKSSLYEINRNLPADPELPLWEGKIEWNQDDSEIQVRTPKRINLQYRVKVASRSEAIEHLLDTLWNGEASVASGPSEIEVAGHHVIHGGRQFKQSAVITAQVKAAITSMSAFASLHNRAELKGIDIVEKRLARFPKSACLTLVFTANCRRPATLKCCSPEMPKSVCARA